MIKLNTLETHDRLQHFKKQDFSISDCCEDLIRSRPFGNYPFYIFAHPRTDDDGVSKRLIWQPRLTKPKAQTNSMLFKCYPGTDVVKIIWMIPARELWPSYQQDKMTECKDILISIDNFLNHRIELEEREDDDLNDLQISEIYKGLSQQAKRKKFMEKLSIKQPL